MRDFTIQERAPVQSGMSMMVMSMLGAAPVFAHVCHHHTRRVATVADARVAWHADLDGDALLLAETDPENLARLDRVWDQAKRVLPD
jgi:hypothetical protein